MATTFPKGKKYKKGFFQNFEKIKNDNASMISQT